LEFYFRFCFRPFHHNRRVILHQATEFRPNTLRKYDVISIFQMAVIIHVVKWLGVIADHPRGVIHGLKSVLKSHVRRINNSGDIAMYGFWRFGLKLPIHAPFGGVLGPYFLTWRHPSSRYPKYPSLGGNTSSFKPFSIYAYAYVYVCIRIRIRMHTYTHTRRRRRSVRISATVRPGRAAREREKKDRTTKKSQKCYIPVFGGTPAGPIRPSGWCIRRNHMCQVSDWNFHGLRFYRWSNFRFSYWFSHEPYNSTALTRCLVIRLYIGRPL